MKTEVSTLSNFITKLEAEFLDGKEAIQLKGGFSPLSSNFGCTNTNCDCTDSCHPTNNCKCTDNCPVIVDNCNIPAEP